MERKWLRELNLSNDWKQYRNNKISINQLAENIATKLSKLGNFPERKLVTINEQKALIIESFLQFSKNGDEYLIDEFDELLETLYTWGDEPIKGSKFSITKQRNCKIIVYEFL